MKAKTKLAVSVYELLDNASYSAVDNKVRRDLVKAICALRKIHKDFTDFRDEAVKRLRPENFDKTAGLIDRFNAMSKEERMEAVMLKEYQDALKANAEFNQAVKECLDEEGGKEVELDIAPLSAEALDSLLDSNRKEWTLGQASEASELFTSED